MLDLLRCPSCVTRLTVRMGIETERRSAGEDVRLGVLGCANGHFFPVIGGVPRMEMHAIGMYRDRIRDRSSSVPEEVARAMDAVPEDGRESLFGGTRRSFSLEWDLWQPGDKTWIWDLDERQRIFANDIDLPSLDLSVPKVALDAGCGNGQLSTAIGKLGLEVFALDLSSGVERAEAMKYEIAGERAPFVHYIQGNLTSPPFESATFDVVYSSGVLHHTPNTEETFRRVLALTKAGGRGYVWLYSSNRKPVKRALSQTLRLVTTRMPPPALRVLCEVMAAPVNVATAALTRAGIRETAPRSAREMAVSLFDELSPRFAHHHRESEVEAWFRSLGFGALTVCSEDRNGFGMRGISGAKM